MVCCDCCGRFPDIIDDTRIELFSLVYADEREYLFCPECRSKRAELIRKAYEVLNTRNVRKEQ